MLVLSRRIDEALIIADNIKVRILDVRGSVVSLGLEAPDDVLILREELNGRRATERYASGADTTAHQPPTGSDYEQPEPGNGS